MRTNDHPMCAKPFILDKQSLNVNNRHHIEASKQDSRIGGYNKSFFFDLIRRRLYMTIINYFSRIKSILKIKREDVRFRYLMMKTRRIWFNEKYF